MGKNLMEFGKRAVKVTSPEHKIRFTEWDFIGTNEVLKKDKKYY